MRRIDYLINTAQRGIDENLKFGVITEEKHKEYQKIINRASAKSNDTLVLIYDFFKSLEYKSVYCPHCCANLDIGEWGFDMNNKGKDICYFCGTEVEFYEN